MNTSADGPRIEPIEQLRPEQFEPLLAQERARWESELEWDFGSVVASFRQLVAARRLSGQALVADGICRGYVYAVFREERCALGGLFFEPGYAEGDWPRLLLARTLDRLRPPCPVQAIEGQLAFPGPESEIGQLLRERGFSFVRRSFMRLQPADRRPPAECHPEVRVLPLRFGDLDHPALVMHRSYRGHPDTRVSSLYSSFPGCARLLEHLVLRGGCGQFDPSCSYSAETGGRLVGAIVVTRISPRSLFVAQVFVHPDAQGLGIGRTLLGQVTRTMALLSPHLNLALTVTTDNTPAREWYTRAGFQEVTPQYAFLRMAGGEAG